MSVRPHLGSKERGEEGVASSTRLGRLLSLLVLLGFETLLADCSQFIRMCNEECRISTYVIRDDGSSSRRGSDGRERPC